MCGYAGIRFFDGRAVPEDRVVRMARSLYHRGPDDEGFHFGPGIGLGHRRLSIIDLSERGHQPMCNEDGTLWIVYNGEVYNYKELNKILIQRGHTIKSHCDTETILHLYEEFGDECVHHLRGMFSFAIWDQAGGRLFAAVDRMGIKPFYYCPTEEFLLFSSEVRAVKASGLHDCRIDPESVYHYLSMETVPIPRTIFQGVWALPGGHTLTLKGNSLHVKKYWDVQYEVDREHSEDYFKKRLLDLLTESVELRLMSDVPLGVFLSGGLDSSCIVGLMQRLQSGPIQTFCIGYDVGQEKYDETRYAEIVSKKFGTDHTVQIVSGRDIASELPSFFEALDQPSTDAINSYFVAKLAAKSVTVALCGQGGDEFFAGYPTSRMLLQFIEKDERWHRLPEWIRALISNAYRRIPGGMLPRGTALKLDNFFDWTGSFVRKYARIRMDLSESEKRDLYTPSAAGLLKGPDTIGIYERHLKEIPESLDILNKASYLDVKTYLENVLLRDGDVMSMAFSLETRFPLIDHKLVEFLTTIPPEFRLRGTVKKYLLRESMRSILPDEIVDRRKAGFAFPFPIWLRHELRPMVEWVLSREHVEDRGLLRYDRLRPLMDAFFAGRELNYRKVWGPLVLELWSRMQEGDRSFFTSFQENLDRSLGKNPSGRSGN